MSKKKSLSLGQVVSLNNELYLLMKESELSFTVKYDLSKLIEKTDKLVKNLRTQNEEILKKYGVCVDEKTQTFKLEGSDKYIEGLKEITELGEKQEVFTESFNMKDFKDLKTESLYVQIMKFLDK